MARIIRTLSVLMVALPLISAQYRKVGVCPQLFNNQVGICVNECNSDNECSGATKCCSNGCGRECKAVQGWQATRAPYLAPYTQNLYTVRQPVQQPQVNNNQQQWWTTTAVPWWFTTPSRSNVFAVTNTPAPFIPTRNPFFPTRNPFIPTRNPWIGGNPWTTTQRPIATFNVGSQCQREREQATSNNGQLIVGRFIPDCLTDGSYMATQCSGSTGYCWCVNTQTGMKQVGTDLGPGRGRPNCGGAGTIPTASAPFTFVSLLATRAPVPVNNNGLCTQQAAAATRIPNNGFIVGNFVPECTRDGGFELSQCHASTGFCWCVHPVTGVEQLDSRQRFTKPDCTRQLGGEGGCARLLENDANAYLGIIVGNYQPQCDQSGNFNRVQCHASIADCWCVNPLTNVEQTGTRINTRTQPPPTCTPGTYNIGNPTASPFINRFPTTTTYNNNNNQFINRFPTTATYNNNNNQFNNNNNQFNNNNNNVYQPKPWQPRPSLATLTVARDEVIKPWRPERTRGGFCPTIKVNDSGATCVKYCDYDTDCGGTQKCCSNGCGRVCSPAN